MGLNISRQSLFYICCAMLIMGFSALGLGIGLLTIKLWEGLIIGFGFGLIFVSLFLMHTYKRMQIFDKEKL